LHFSIAPPMPGFAGVGSLTQSLSGDPIEVVMVTAEPASDFDREWS
jgi:hypothetical protein